MTTAPDRCRLISALLAVEANARFVINCPIWYSFLSSAVHVMVPTPNSAAIARSDFLGSAAIASAARCAFDISGAPQLQPASTPQDEHIQFVAAAFGLNWWDFGFHAVLPS